MFVSAAIEVMTVISGEGTELYSSQSPTFDDAATSRDRRHCYSRVEPLQIVLATP